MVVDQQHANHNSTSRSNAAEPATSIQYTNGTKQAHRYAVEFGPGSAVESNWRVSGTVTVSNPNSFAVSGGNVSDAIADTSASCSVSDRSNVRLEAGESAQSNYTCSYSATPGSPRTNVATVSWPDIGSPSIRASGQADFVFELDDVIDECVDVSDAFNSGSADALGKDAFEASSNQVVFNP